MQIRDSFTHPDIERERSGWFTCSCCPTNVVRLLPSIPGYMYAQNGKDVYVNLFISGSGNFKVNNKEVKITQQNNYPWDGALAFTIDPASALDMNLRIRIPGWAQDKAIPSDLYNYEKPSAQKIEIKVNGKAVDYQMQNGYAVISKKWKKNDRVELNLPMDVQRVVANDKLKDDNGKIAIQRGPIMYCAEWKDNAGKPSSFIVAKDVVFTPSYNDDLLNGVTVLKAEVKSIQVDEAGQNVTTTNSTLTAIPYYSWANRGKGEMTVWFPEQVKYIDILSK
jgi:DUF1680 family protein